IYDKTGSVPEQPPSPVIESERRLFYVAVTRAKKHLYIGTVASPPSGQQSQATAPLPSRFLAEMDLESTQTVISAGLEMLQNGDGHKLLAIIDKGEGRRSMIRYVAENYLRSSELFDPVMKSIEQMSETDFEYPYDYPDLGQESSKHKELEPVPWSDPWAGIGALN
ncbi:hypothetical protein J7M28_03275, partial [bacterium]|nr:hypothetical protein [bacterium]